MEQLNELALFAGAGGGILGGKLLGWRTVCAVEFDAYAASVLLQRQNDGCLPPFPVWDDVRTFDGKPWRGIVDVVSGGFPCQDISAAGKGAGITGERSGLWKEFARIIREVGPRYVFVENSPLLTSRGLDTVLGDLAEMGLDAEWCVLGAVDVGAPHMRDRIWIVAHSPGDYCHAWQTEPARQQRQAGATDGGDDVADAVQERRNGRPRERGNGWWQQSENCRCLMADTTRFQQGREIERTERKRIGESCEPIDVADADPVDDDDSRPGTGKISQQQSPALSELLPDSMRSGSSQPEHQREHAGSTPQCGWWLSEPDVGRVANGVAARVDRLKAIGNGQVPLVAATAWEMLLGR